MPSLREVGIAMTGTKRKMARSFLLNLVAVAVPLVVIQLLVLPLVGQRMGSDQYGFVVAIFAFFSLMPGVMGNSLNNIRLIHETDWGADAEGDFNVLQVSFAVVAALVVALYAALNGYLNAWGLGAIALTALLWALREYGCVAFLVSMDYGSILGNSLWMSAGYLAGYAVFALSGAWTVIFLMGQAASVIYIVAKTRPMRAGIEPSERLGGLARESGVLMASTFVARSASYCDRVILYPLIGGTSVAIYYAATLVPKLVNMVASSMNSVILSFLSRRKVADRAELLVVLGVGLGVCVVCYGIVMVLAPPVLSVLYPQFVSASLSLLPIVTATAFTVVLSTLVSPYVLKYRSLRWQIVVSSTSLALYLGAALALLSLFGLMGFCVGALLAEVARLLALLGIFFFGKDRSCAE